MRIRYGILALIMVLCVGTKGQEKRVANTKLESSGIVDAYPLIRNLKIGDKVPDIFIAKIINDKSRSANITDFKSQLLIVDFWHTGCGSCIEALPKLDTLQRKYGDQLKILPVTWQNEAVVSLFFKTNKMVKNLKLPCVVEDKVLASHFKHKLVSHEVWIYKGVVKAITGTEYVNDDNIKTLLAGKELSLPLKNDLLEFDPEKAIFSLNNEEQYDNTGRHFEYSGITGYRDITRENGLEFRDDSLNNTYRTFFYNFPITSAYIALLTKITPKKFIAVHPGRIILEVKDPMKYMYNHKYGYFDRWKRKNEICYEMVLSKPTGIKERCSKVILDLNQKLGLNGRFEKRKVKCVVLVQNIEKPVVPDSIQSSKSAMTLDNFLFGIELGMNYPPTINESNFMGKLVVNPGGGTIVDFKRSLNAYGFDLLELEREIEVFVLTEVN